MARGEPEIIVAILACAVCMLFIPMSGYVVHKHHEVVSSPVALAIMDGRQIVETDLHGGVHATARVKTDAYFKHDANKTLFSVAVKYPPPPEDINLQKEKKMRSWLSTLTGEVEVYVYTDEDNAYDGKFKTAYTDAIGIVGWGFMLAIGIICWLVVIFALMAAYAPKLFDFFRDGCMSCIACISCRHRHHHPIFP